MLQQGLEAAKEGTCTYPFLPVHAAPEEHSTPGEMLPCSEATLLPGKLPELPALPAARDDTPGEERAQTKQWYEQGENTGKGTVEFRTED